MEMSVGELRMRYRQAANPKRQLRILADLNGCEVDAIKQALGLGPKQRDMSFARYLPLYRRGMTDKEIAAEAGVTVSAVKHFRHFYGLEPNKKYKHGRRSR